MIVELRKGQNYSKILKTISNFKKSLIQNIKIFKTILLSQETVHYPYFKP